MAQIDLGTFTVVNRVALEKESLPHMLHVSPDGRRVWVQNRKAHTNVFLEVEPFRVLKTIRVGKVPVTNAFTPDGRHSYVTNKKGGTVSVVDTKTLEEVLRFKVGPGPNPEGPVMLKPKFRPVAAEATQARAATAPRLPTPPSWAGDSG